VLLAALVSTGEERLAADLAAAIRAHYSTRYDRLREHLTVLDAIALVARKRWLPIYDTAIAARNVTIVRFTDVAFCESPALPLVPDVQWRCPWWNS
jgi:hypothetical protein